VRSFSVIPFDSTFRYLFLYDNNRCQNWNKLHCLCAESNQSGHFYIVENENINFLYSL
jgi:hypothetical protein